MKKFMLVMGLAVISAIGFSQNYIIDDSEYTLTQTQFYNKILKDAGNDFTTSNKYFLIGAGSCVLGSVFYITGNYQSTLDNSLQDGRGIKILGGALYVIGTGSLITSRVFDIKGKHKLHIGLNSITLKINE